MHGILRFCLCIALVAGAVVASAKPPFLKIFLATYKISPNSAIAKARCLNCHMPPGPPKRNPYGLEVGNAMAAAGVRLPTPEILKGLETKKGPDGVAFGAKIKKDVPPGNPMPKAPAKPAKKTSKGKKHALFIPDGSSMMVLLCSLAPLALVGRRKSS